MANITSISLSVNASTIKLYGSTTFIVTATYSDGTTRDITDFCSYTLPSGSSSTSSGVTTVSNNIIELTHAAGTDISSAKVTCGSRTYTGSTLTANNITVVYGSTTLVENRDYEVTSNYGGTTVGSYNVTITGIGNYRNSVSGTFSIIKANPSYTAPTAKTGLTYTGSSQTLYNTGSNTTAGSFSYSNGTRTSAGSQTVSWSFTPTDTTNYNSISSSFTCTIARATGSISFTTKPMSVGMGSTVATAISKTGDGSVSYSSSNTSVVTVNSSGVITGVAQGTATITVTLSAGTNYTGASDSYTITCTFMGVGIYTRSGTIVSYNDYSVSSDDYTAIVLSTSNVYFGIPTIFRGGGQQKWCDSKYGSTLVSGMTTTDDQSVAKTDYNGYNNCTVAYNTYNDFGGAIGTTIRDGDIITHKQYYVGGIGEANEFALNFSSLYAAAQKVSNLSSILDYVGTNMWTSTQMTYSAAWFCKLTRAAGQTNCTISCDANFKTAGSGGFECFALLKL